MNGLPWGPGDDEDRDEDAPDGPIEGDPVISCEFQDGTLAVYEDRLHVARTSRSKFADKTIALNQVTDVTYESRLVISYLQIHQTGFENDGKAMLSTPVDENTLHFGRGKRECARRARDAIFERMASA